MPSYTPIRRNPAHGSYQRTKPQSPKILLPQCFLDQPLNQINNNGVYSSSNGQSNLNNMNTGMQGVMGIGKTMPNGKGINKINPTISQGDAANLSGENARTTPTALQSRHKSDAF